MRRLALASHPSIAVRRRNADTHQLAPAASCFGSTAKRHRQDGTTPVAVVRKAPMSGDCMSMRSAASGQRALMPR